jgi:hypothetical protein
VAQGYDDARRRQPDDGGHEAELADSGFEATVRDAGPKNVVTWERGGAKYSVRDYSTSWDGPSADFTPAGGGQQIKFRLSE